MEKLLVWTSSGIKFMEQHWYFYYTCDLSTFKGCCSICVRVCYRGHIVVYSHLRNLFCDYGVEGVRGTRFLCLKPQTYDSSITTSLRGASRIKPFLLLLDGRDHLYPYDNNFHLENDGFLENKKPFKLSIPKEEEVGYCHYLCIWILKGMFWCYVNNFYLVLTCLSI